ncbi:unnamed protein product, partial [Pylaiella littoralis]
GESGLTPARKTPPTRFGSYLQQTLPRQRGNGDVVLLCKPRCTRCTDELATSLDESVLTNHYFVVFLCWRNTTSCCALRSEHQPFFVYNIRYILLNVFNSNAHCSQPRSNAAVVHRPYSSSSRGASAYTTTTTTTNYLVSVFFCYCCRSSQSSLWL